MRQSLQTFFDEAMLEWQHRAREDNSRYQSLTEKRERVRAQEVVTKDQIKDALGGVV